MVWVEYGRSEVGVPAKDTSTLKLVREVVID